MKFLSDDSTTFIRNLNENSIRFCTIKFDYIAYSIQKKDKISLWRQGIASSFVAYSKHISCYEPKVDCEFIDESFVEIYIQRETHTQPLCILTFFFHSLISLSWFSKIILDVLRVQYRRCRPRMKSIHRYTMAKLKKRHENRMKRDGSKRDPNIDGYSLFYPIVIGYLSKGNSSQKRAKTVSSKRYSGYCGKIFIGDAQWCEISVYGDFPPTNM